MGAGVEEEEGTSSTSDCQLPSGIIELTPVVVGHGCGGGEGEGGKRSRKGVAEV